MFPNKRQRDLLSKEDWRHYVVGIGGTGLFMLATSELIKVKGKKEVLSFSLPSASAIYINAALDCNIRRKEINYEKDFKYNFSSNSFDVDDHKSIFDFFQEISTEIILSLAAVEAFANECIKADHVYGKKYNDGVVKSLSGKQIEEKVGLEEKIDCVIPSIYGLKSPKGSRSWSGFKTLVNLRNQLVHIKTSSRKSSGPDQATIWLNLLEQKNTNFPAISLQIIGYFETLVKDRRWFNLAKSKINSVNTSDGR